MRHLLPVALAVAVCAALDPGAVRAGSATYGDPPGWCTRYSDMWRATVVTNDPLVATNPERDTFYGFHPNPGYDDWYGYFYGDFRGSAGDASGWIKLLHELYPAHYHWNFADFGWAVHGHAKQYIAYYNWTFGGECGLGRAGDPSPPPFMADQYGWPVVDIYVDAVAPYPPVPRVVAATATSVTFTWDPVADRGDGAGADFYEAGLDHYTSWLTISGSSNRLQLTSSAVPLTVVQSLSSGQAACLHVSAYDRVGNGTSDQVVCATALAPPPMPGWGPLASGVQIDPPRRGLTGLESWLWLWPKPRTEVIRESYLGVDYEVTATPVGVDWDFGDGVTLKLDGGEGGGQAYPARSSVTHVYSTFSRSGYLVQADVRYDVSWRALVGGTWLGPYQLGPLTRGAVPLLYPVVQAQPELIALGG